MGSNLQNLQKNTTSLSSMSARDGSTSSGLPLPEAKEIAVAQKITLTVDKDRR